MQGKQGILWVKISVVVTFLIMISANALANLTFSIWGAIYLLLAGYVLYALGFFQADKNNVKTEL